MKKISIITLFPSSIEGYLNSSIIKRAIDRGVLCVQMINPRNFTKDKHNKADDRPYGGGPGMVMLAEPVVEAVRSVIKKGELTKIVFTSPAGKDFSNKTASSFASKYSHLIIVCGHYEGIDARAKKILRAEEYTIGPYILTGGELPALVMADAIARQMEGVLGNKMSVEEKRISSHNVYTRPEIIVSGDKKYRVPKVLLSGHHKKIDLWKECLDK